MLAAVLASAGVALAAGAHHDPRGLALVAGGLRVALGATANALVQHPAAAASLNDQARHLAQVIQAFRLSEAA